KGWFYPEGHPLSSGEVEMKQMTAFHEDLLSNQNYIKNGTVIDKLLEALVVNKFPLGDLLVPDKNALIIVARRLAYGDEMPATIACPKCQQDNKVVVNLGNIVAKPFDFEKYPKGRNLFEFTLPVSKKVLSYKILCQTDENAIEVELKNLSKISPE